MGYKLNRITRAMQMALDLINRCSIGGLRARISARIPKKRDQEFTEYQRVNDIVYSDPSDDIEFPIQPMNFNQNNVSNTVSVTPIVHTGSYADELALSMNALAVAIGYDIYFRGGKYKPETEEGRKLIAHEMKHVEQHHDRRIYQNTDLEILEKEAEFVENKEVYDSDPYKLYIIGKKRFYFRNSQIKKIVLNAANGIEEWMNDQKYVRNNEDYSKLLLAYKTWLRER